MPSKPNECKCMQLLEMKESINDYSNEASAQMLDTWGSSCPVLFQHVADHLIARLAHMRILSVDPDIRDGDVADEMARTITEMSGRLPALLAEVIEEADTREKQNASN